MDLAQNEDRVEILKNDFEYLIKTRQWQKAELKMNHFYAEYPENPSELSRVEKYEVDQYALTIKEALYGEQRTFLAIQNTKSIRVCEEYLTLYPHGKYVMEVKSIMLNQKEKQLWEKSELQNTISSYKKYLSVYPNGKYSDVANKAIKTVDLQAYQKAKNSGTPSAYTYYLNNYPYGKYKNEVRELLEIAKEKILYQKAKDNNYITYYEDYIAKYPNGKYATKVNKIIENSYYKFGNEAYTSKKYSKAKGYYETYLSKFPYGTYSLDVKSKIKICQRKLNQSSASFLMYTYDSNSPFGISIGDLNTNSTGYYFNFKLNAEIFTGLDVLYDIDNTGKHDRPGNVIRTGEVEYANMSLSGGLTFKIVYPLWAYIGGGVGLFPVYEHADTYYSSGKY